MASRARHGNPMSIFVQEVAYQKASEGFEVAKVAGAMAAEVPGDFWADSFPREPGRVMYSHIPLSKHYYLFFSNHYHHVIFF